MIPVKTGGCNQLAPAASPAVNAVRLTVSVPVCSTGATSPFSLTSEINRVSVVAPGRIIRCCISHPVARSKSRPGRSLLIQLRVYKKTGKAKCPGPGKFTILIVLTYQRCMLTAGIFPLTVFCKNGDITNPELSGGKMPDAGRNMTWDLRAPAPTPSHLRATVAIKGSFRGAEF